MKGGRKNGRRKEEKMEEESWLWALGFSQDPVGNPVPRNELVFACLCIVNKRMI